MIQTPPTILLFDVDGVLIEDYGYQSGITRTVGYFASAMGLPGMAPTAADIEVFEANGLTSEWESCPLAVGALLIAALRVTPGLVLSDQIDEALAQCRPVVATGGVQRPDFAQFARRVGPRIASGDHPSHASFAILMADASALNLTDAAQRALATLLHTLLDHTQNVYGSPVTQVFQHFALGSQDYARTYGLVPRFETPSLLRTLDQPALSPQGRNTLLGLIASGQACAAIFTARASLPPGNTEADPRGYSPEAEIARTLVGLEALPLVGYGRLSWLATRHGEAPDSYVKPSPIHALAGIGAALTGREAEAVEAAHALAEEGIVLSPLDALRGQTLDLFVFEDAINGVRAATRAVELLRSARIGVNLWIVGILPPGGPKRAALAPLCALIAPDVNSALASVTGMLQDRLAVSAGSELW
jgi:hypothetical protein